MRKFSIILLISVMSLVLFSEITSKTNSNNNINIFTIKEVIATLPNESRVIITGQIIEKISDDKYLFSDGDNSIYIKDNNKLVDKITSKDKVKIMGKVDKQWWEFGSTKVQIDIEKIHKIS